MATLLADWDAGSTSAFVTKMDLTAVSLGLRHTRITEPSGADDAITEVALYCGVAEEWVAASSGDAYSTACKTSRGRPGFHTYPVGLR